MDTSARKVGPEARRSSDGCVRAWLSAMLEGVPLAPRAHIAVSLAEPQRERRNLKSLHGIGRTRHRFAVVCGRPIKAAKGTVLLFVAKGLGWWQAYRTSKTITVLGSRDGLSNICKGRTGGRAKWRVFDNYGIRGSISC